MSSMLWTLFDIIIIINNCSHREDDVELARLDSQLDVWCSELKSNVLVSTY